MHNSKDVKYLRKFGKYVIGVRGSIRVRDKKPVYSAKRPAQLWGSSRLLSNGYLKIFLLGQSGRRVKLITHPLMP
jgi:hypothetical protein